MKDRARLLIIGCLAAVACSPSPGATNAQQGKPYSLPTGVRTEDSGYWTIEQAPNSPAMSRVEPSENQMTIYAQIAGVSNGEAEKRRKEQEASRPELERLIRMLRAKERGNYTDAELIHRPDWAYLIYFKRNPATTLARYTKNPRFQARPAPYTEAELQRLTRTWIDRLTSERLTTGYAMNARQGRADIDMMVSEEEFAAIAQRKGWGRPPDYLNLKFDTAPVGAAIDPAVAAGVRIFPQSDRNLGATNQAALGGKIVLKNGCLFVVGHDGKMQLAYFAREVGLGIDRQGYLSLHRRTAEPQRLGRIGGMFTWAGPIGIDESTPMVADLRQRCGTAPLMHVGIPESSAIFHARYGLPRGRVAPPQRPGASGRAQPRPEPLLQPAPSPPRSPKPEASVRG